MVIEIEHKEIAGIVREQRIDADDIAAVLPLAFQMGEQSADIQRFIGPVRAVPAGNFLPCRFRAEFVIPKMRTGRKITRFSVLWAAADAVYIFAASEIGIEKRDHLRCDLVLKHTAALIGNRGYLIFSRLRIRNPVLFEQRPQRRVFLFKLHDPGLQCIHGPLLL